MDSTNPIKSGFSIGGSGGAGVGLDDFVDAFADPKAKQQIKKSRKHRLELPDTTSVTATRREQRKDRLDFIKHDTRKWNDQLTIYNEAEQIDYTPVDPSSRTNTNVMASEFKPLSAFEEALEQAVKASGVVVEKNPSEKETRQQNVAEQRGARDYHHLRQLLQRETTKQTRIKLIKSKTWRRIHRKALDSERVRLLEKLEIENPKLAEEFRVQFQKKIAHLRSMKQQAARSRWAKTAMRFGGPDIRREISKQAQEAHDEKVNLRRVGQKIESDSDESGSDAEAAQERPDATAKNENKTKLLVQLSEIDAGDGELPSKGLLAMPFMRRAIEQQRHETKVLLEEAQEDIDRIQDIGANVLGLSHDQENDAEEEEASWAANTRKSRRRSEKKIVIPESEVQAAIAKLLGGDVPSAGGELANEPPSVERQAAKDESCTEGDGEAAPERPSIRASDLAREYWDRAGKRRAFEANVDEKQSAAKFQEPSRESKTLGVEPAKAEWFKDVLDASDEDVLTASSDDEEMTTKAHGTTEEEMRNLPGWGGWCRDVKEANDKILGRAIPRRKKRIVGKVAFSSKKDDVAPKYTSGAIPYPFENAAQYHASIGHPLGTEWNTLSSHKRFVAPQIRARPGCSILPAQLARGLAHADAESVWMSWEKTRQSKQGHSQIKL